jgi:hypothetical protein
VPVVAQSCKKGMLIPTMKLLRHCKAPLVVANSLARLFACLQEARGGDIAVREGVVSLRPAVTVQPADATVDEGGNAQLSIVATVSSTQKQLACLVEHIRAFSKPLSSAL